MAFESTVEPKLTSNIHELLHVLCKMCHKRLVKKLEGLVVITDLVGFRMNTMFLSLKLTPHNVNDIITTEN